MGLFSKIKETNKNIRDNIAKKNEERGKLSAAFITVSYVGGYNDISSSVGSLSFYENCLEYKVALNKKSSFTIYSDAISSINIEGRDEVSRRVTVTRLLAIGIFAFAVKKKSKDKESFIIVTTKDKQEVIFNINKVSPMEVRAKLSKLRSQIA